MKSRTRNDRNKGFSMVEVLAAVAIIVILLGVSAVSVVRYIDVLKITELDNAARDIYMAAENRAVLLTGNQQMDGLLDINGTKTTLSARSNTSGVALFADDSGVERYYVSSTNIDKNLLDTGNIDPALWDGDFYIVYDRASGSVTDVFYAKDTKALGTILGKYEADETTKADPFAAFYNEWADIRPSVRLELKNNEKNPNSTLVGYYNGDAAEGSAQPIVPAGQPIIDVVITNEEKLTVTVTVKFGPDDGVTDENVRQAVIKAIQSFGDDGLKVMLGAVGSPTKGTPLTTSDRNGSSTEGYADSGFDNVNAVNSTAYSWTWVLDSMVPDGDKEKHFKEYNFDVNPGDDFEVMAYINKTDKLYYLHDTDVSNSLFAYQEAGEGQENGSNGTTAYIEYLRHLQNLSMGNGYDSGVNTVSGKEKTSAVQIGDIQVYGNEVYGEYNFIPILNGKLETYRVESISGGATVSANATEKYYEIRDLKVDLVANGSSYPSDTNKANIGLFSVPSGMTFENIRLVNAAVKAPEANTNSSVGALAGTASGDTTIKNCWVYWDEYDDLGSDVEVDGETYKYQLTGATVGGLVGTANGKTTIDNSLAATLIKGSSVAGGLVGQLSGTETNTIQTSYADCYLTGDTTKAGGQVAGLVGNLTTNVTLTNCYAAGFIVGVSDTENTGFDAAGLCLGAGKTDATNVYSVIRYPKAGDSRQNADSSNIHYLTGKSGETFAPADNVHFLLGSESNKMSNGVQGETYNEMTDSSDGETNFAKRMGNAFTGKMTTLNSHPYNLLTALSLTYYVYPGLVGLDHYGDWAAQFKEPSMVYYEKYGESDWGLSGGNARTVINSLSSNNTVKDDGYGVAFLEADLEEIKKQFGKKVTSVSLTYNYLNENGVTAGTTIDFAINANSLITWRDSGTTFKAYLIPLPDTLVWSDHFQNCFYWYFEFKLTYKSNGEEVGTPSTGQYFFNPHFAETVSPYIYDSNDEAANPNKWTNWENAKQYAEAAEKSLKQITIRTPRHLYFLSQSEKYYTRTDTFSQDLPLDYSKYNGPDNGRYSKLFNQASPYKQSPIGSEETPFKGTYNGNCNAIKNVVPEVDNKRAYTGLFGTSSGTLRNVVYDMGASECKFALKSEDALNFYIGGLVGHNANGGLIDNCAVEGVKLSATVSQVHLYMGGLVGQNDATIRNSAAETQITATSPSYDYLYLGGFVGQNGASGSITTSYAVGYIDAELSDSTKEAYLCGFVGSNAGTVSNSYAAVGLNYSGGTPNVYGFASGGALNRTFYLDQGSFSYRDINYTAKYTQEGEKSTSLTYDKLAREKADSVPVSGMQWGKNADADGNYLYPTAVKKGNDYVHYGAFPKLMDLGEMGVFYWEEITKDGKQSYHFYALAVDPSNGGSITAKDTLLTNHDDGTAVTNYGYGYYYKSGTSAPAFTANNIRYTTGKNDAVDIDTLEGLPKNNGTLNDNDINSIAPNKVMYSGLVNVLSTNASQWQDGGAYLDEKPAKEGLESALSGEYVFWPWNSYHEVMNKGEESFEGKVINGLCPVQNTNGSENNYSGWTKLNLENCTFELSRGTTSVTFIVNPHFAASMSVKTAPNGWTNIENKINTTNKPGSSTNPFQIRCGWQFQNINWHDLNRVDAAVGYEKVTATQTNSNNGTVGNVTMAYETFYSNDERFPYLAGFVDDNDGDYHWVQTHDVDWTAEGNSKDGKPGVFFSVAQSRALDARNVIQNKKQNQNSTGDYFGKVFNTWKGNAWVDPSGKLSGWFAGYYDGGNYMMKNLNIQTKASANAMGMFGAVIGSDLQNIVLYSDGEGNTVTITGREASCSYRWYVGGVLVGLAQDTSISNCAVAGYEIIDESRNGGARGAAVGGLVGAINGKLDKCAAVVNIKMHPQRGDSYSAAFNYLRVGGLAGSTAYDVSNCYTGGTITILSGANLHSSKTNSVKRGTMSIGRIIGGTGMEMLDGINGINGGVTVKNCYSYLTLPTNLNTRQNVGTVFGSTANNSDDYFKVDLYNIGGEGGSNTANNQGMVDVKLKTLTNNYHYGDNVQTADTTSTPVTYRQLAGLDQITSKDTTLTTRTGYIYQLLNQNNADTDGTKGPNFYKVTADVDGLAASGRYTYVPKSASELNGIDYLFPTVLMVEKNHVHYGAWTLSGIRRYADKDRTTGLGNTPVELDLFTPEEGKSEAGVHTEYLGLELDDGVTAPGAWTATIDVETNEAAYKYISVQLGSGTATGGTITSAIGGTDKTETLTITALQDYDGPIKVTVTKGADYKRTITVYITAKVALEPAEVSIFPKDTLTVPLGIYGIRPGVSDDPYDRSLKGTLTIYADSIKFEQTVLNAEVARDNDGKYIAELRSEGSSWTDAQWVSMDYTYAQNVTVGDASVSKSVDGTHSIAVKLLALPEHMWTQKDGKWIWIIDFGGYDVDFAQEDVHVDEGSGVILNVNGKKITLTAETAPTSDTSLTVDMTSNYVNGTENGIELTHKVDITVPRPVTPEDLTLEVRKSTKDEAWTIDFGSKYTIERVMEGETEVSVTDNSVTLTGVTEGKVTLTVTLTGGNGLKQTFDLTVDLTEPKVSEETIKANGDDSWTFDVSDWKFESAVVTNPSGIFDAAVDKETGKCVITLKDGATFPSVKQEDDTSAQADAPDDAPNTAEVTLEATLYKEGDNSPKLTCKLTFTVTLEAPEKPEADPENDGLDIAEDELITFEPYDPELEAAALLPEPELEPTAMPENPDEDDPDEEASEEETSGTKLMKARP